jgi:hypothetical protein
MYFSIIFHLFYVYFLKDIPRVDEEVEEIGGGEEE